MCKQNSGPDAGVKSICGQKVLFNKPQRSVLPFRAYVLMRCGSVSESEWDRDLGWEAGCVCYYLAKTTVEFVTHSAASATVANRDCGEVAAALRSTLTARRIPGRVQ